MSPVCPQFYAGVIGQGCVSGKAIVLWVHSIAFLSILAWLGVAWSHYESPLVDSQPQRSLSPPLPRLPVYFQV